MSLLCILTPVTSELDPEDNEEFGRPPAPEDRLWRHPSEMAPQATTSNSGPVTFVSRSHLGRPNWVVGILSSFMGAAVTLGVLAALGTFEDRPANTVVEQVQRTLPKQPDTSELAIAQQVIPAVVRVEAAGSGAATGGSAVVVRTDGHMITTADAVDGADTITVTFSDGQTSPAHLVGVDRSTDVAVIKADRTDVPSAVIGQADDLQLGEPTIAIACTSKNPEAPLISVGLVNGISEHIVSSTSPLYGVIRTNLTLDDKASSAGAVLIDSSGSVIGVITSRGEDQHRDIPTEFAIPMNLAKSIADELIATGHVTRPWLGVEGTDLTPQEHDHLGRGGAKVTVVSDGGPANSAGIRAGDVIVSVDGKAINSMADLVVLLRSHKPADVVALGFVSNGEAQVGMATLVDREATTGSTSP